jgi:hypothetical protein
VTSPSTRAARECRTRHGTLHRHGTRNAARHLPSAKMVVASRFFGAAGPEVDAGRRTSRTSSALRRCCTSRIGSSMWHVAGSGRGCAATRGAACQPNPTIHPPAAPPSSRGSSWSSGRLQLGCLARPLSVHCCTAGRGVDALGGMLNPWYGQCCASLSAHHHCPIC